MMKASEICRDERRRHLVLTHRNAKGQPDVNGIDYIDVDEHDQRQLTVYLIDKAPANIDAKNVRITGGKRIRDIQVKHFRYCHEDDPEQDDCLKVTVDKAGDFSPYTLCLVEQGVDEKGQPVEKPLTGFDPRYACAEFSFKVNCPSDLDCQPDTTCPAPSLDEPEITYLAKDYASFRQLILDRLALIMPDWKERHVPDLGITLVELLAYVGDYLSYYQDAVATEAYLATARQRISVRRHARLVDYQMHEGCNARAWVFVETSQDIQLNPQEVYFITGANDALSVSSTMLSNEELQEIPSDTYEVFEPLVANPSKSIQLYEVRNEILFYTWGNAECCLPRGATTATLRDEWVSVPSPSSDVAQQEQGPTEESSSSSRSSRSRRRRKQEQQEPETSKGEQAPAEQQPEQARKLQLKVGDILIFEEVMDPKTGDPDDADPAHRHIVRLTRVERDVDRLPDSPVPVLEIEWAVEDKLPFPLCLSAIGPAPWCELLTDISVARGNIILADHGQTFRDEWLGRVDIEKAIPVCEGEGNVADTVLIPSRFHPSLKKTPLTFSLPLPDDAPFFSPVVENPHQAVVLTSASRLMTQDQDPHQALPQVKLTGTRTLFGRSIETTWTARPDLLASGRDDCNFVVEIDNDGEAHLRFGDGELGHIPEAETAFRATYRTGNGLAGNVGADAISHIVFHRTKLEGMRLQPRNPLPAKGGKPPEPLAEVKLFAPRVFRTDLQRAITADDYARLAEGDPRIQRAVAVLRWMGDWYEMAVAIDPRDTEEASDDLIQAIEKSLESYRRIGHDLKVVPARYVPLEIEMEVCVLPHYLRGHVEAALLDAFSNRPLPNGQRGFFHPDNLTFGEGVSASKLVAVAQAIPGVENVRVSKLQRFAEEANRELEAGILKLGPTEIAQLDNDPSFPEHGTITFKMGGGR